MYIMRNISQYIVTSLGKVPKTAAATGKAQSPSVERRVTGTTKVAVCGRQTYSLSLERRWTRA